MRMSLGRLARALTPRFRLRTLFGVVALAAVGVWAWTQLPIWQRWWQIRQARSRISQYERTVACDGDPSRALPELVAILGDSRLRHWGSANAVATGPGERLMSFGGDNRLRFWDVASGEQTAVLRGKCFAASVDGNRAFVANDENEIIVWDVAAGEALGRLRGDNAKPFRCLAANLDGSVAAALGGDLADAQVTVWTVPTGEVTAQWDVRANVPRGRVANLSLSGDGRLVATLNDLNADVWDSATGAKVRHLPCITGDRGEVGAMKSVVLSHNGTQAFSADALGVVRSWDVATGQPIVLHTFPGMVSGLTLNREGRLMTACLGGTVAELVLQDEGWSLAAEHSLSPNYLIACSRETDLRFFSESDQSLSVWRRGQPVQSAPSLDLAVTCLAFTPDGKYLITGRRSGELVLWEVGTWLLHTSWQGHNKAVRHVLASPTGATFGSVSMDRTLVVWDLATQQQTATIPLVLGSDWPAFTSDGQGIVLAADMRRSRPGIRVHDAATGQVTATLTGDRLIRGQIVPTPDGKQFLAGASRTTLSIWDLAEGKMVRTLGPNTMDSVRLAVSPDGGWVVASFGLRGLAVWDLATGDERWQLPDAHADAVQSVALSPDGRLIASAATDGFARFWSAEDGRLVCEFALCPPGGLVRQVAFSPDGTYLATANGNGTAYVLDIKGIRSGRRH